MGARASLPIWLKVEGDGEGSASNPLVFAFAGDAIPTAVLTSMIQANWLLTQSHA